MDHRYPIVAKIPVLDTRKFEQRQFQIQQYLQHEHYALWEVIEFGDSYKVPTNTNPDDTTTRRDVEKSRRTVTFTTKDMQKKKNDVKARTTLLLSLPDEYQLRDSYEVPASTESTTTTDTISGETGKKSGRTITLTAEDMQKKKNDVKARTTLLLSLPDEHQLRFSKYKTARELWAAILKTFGGNETTKKTKKNLLKQ
nr:hypothetical protein [Tanacetum cinerariifolium]